MNTYTEADLMRTGRALTLYCVASGVAFISAIVCALNLGM